MKPSDVPSYDATASCTAPLREASGAPHVKELRHELIAEAIGCAVMIMFGNGVVAAWGVGAFHGDTTSAFAKGTYTNVAWAIGVTFGVMVSFNTSGAFLNVALQLNAMLTGGFPIKKGLLFMLAQTLGCFVGALLTALNFVILKGGSKLTNFFCTSPGEGVSFVNAAVNEIIATALLAMCLAAVTNERPPFNKFHLAGFAGLCVFGIGNVFGPQTGYALNPARDFGPRMCYLLLALIYGKGDIWNTVLGGGYFIVPIVAPCLGAIIGGLVYKYFIFLVDLPDDVSSRKKPESLPM